MASLAACDSAEPPAFSVSVIDYRTEDGRSIKLHLQDSYDGTGRTFATPQEYVAVLENLRSSATDLTVNRSVWETLKNSNDPYVVSFLDNSSSLTVGDNRYEFGPTAVLKTPTADPSSEPALEIYYGVDGLEKYREIQRLNEFASMPGELSRMSFRNPDIQLMADRLVEEGGDHTDAPGLEKSAVTSATASRFWGTERQYSPEFAIYTDSGALWVVRITGYNQDYGSWIQGYKAAGATQLQVYSNADGQWGAVGFGNRPYSLGTQVDIRLLLKRDSPASAWNKLSCTSRRDENSDVPYNNCNLLNASGNRATGWDPRSEHYYRIYERSGDPGNPFASRVVGSATLIIN